MKILITTGIYPPSIGGPATYSKLLFDELPKKDISVRVLSYDEVRKYPKGFSHFIFFLKTLWQAKNVDFIYTQDPVSVGWPTMWAAKILKKKYVLKVVGDFAWEQGVRRFGVTDTLDDFVSLDHQYKKDVHRLKSVQKEVAENAEKIIVPSYYLKKIVSKWGIAENKIKVIYNAFSDDPTLNSEIKDSESKIKIREELDLSGNIMISVGRLVPWKGFGTLISLMPTLLKKFPDLKLLIAGSGPQKEELEKLIFDLNLNDSIKLLGQLPKKDLYKYIKASDLFVLNTNYEGLSHQLLEVLSIGIPIVTTNVGGNPELIEDKKNGLLVNYDDQKELEMAIENILLDESLALDLVSNGKESVKKFSKEKMLEELVDEFKSL